MPRHPKTYPPALVEAVTELYGQGMTQAEVAAALSITEKVVYGLMRRHDIPRRPRIKRDQHGEKNSSWRGDDATYAACHYRVYKLRGQPQECEECGASDPAKRYEWANLTGAYSDPSDYRRLCASCHRRLDGVVRNFGAYAVRLEVPCP